MLNVLIKPERFAPDRFFKKRQQEKQRLRPLRGDGDDDSVEDVDDDEFERILGNFMNF